MMSQINAPIHSYENPRIYHSAKNQLSKKMFGHFYSASQTWFNDSDPILERSKKDLFNIQNSKAVQPNPEKPGSLNSPTNKKIFLNNFEYNLWSKNAEYVE